MGQQRHDDLRRTALDHCIVPLATMHEVYEGNLHIYAKGDGITLTDVDGRSYLDLMSAGTRANSLGYGNREIAQAVADQLATLHYVGTVTNLTEPAIRLAAKLAELTPGRLAKTLFVSGGSEAVEAAFKLARQYHVATGRKPRAYKIISRWNAYHGATMGAQAATDWLGTRHISEPGMIGYSQIPAPMCYRNPFGLDQTVYNDLCADYLARQIEHEGPENVAAFIAEPVMQANGVQIPPAGYFRRVREICDEYDVLFIADEVITGFGRTGAWFAMEHFGVEPDLMTVAKAITAGYQPLGAVIARAEIADALPIFRHVHTFSGHAAAAAAANAVIAILERDNLVERGRENGAYFLAALQRELEPLPIVGQVRGLGMWLAVDFTRDKATRSPFTDDTVPAVVRRMRELGVIASPIGTAFELAPPLITSRAELDRAVAVARQAIVEVARQRGLG